MNFDARTEAQREREDEETEAKIKLYARTCACLAKLDALDGDDLAIALFSEIFVKLVKIVNPTSALDELKAARRELGYDQEG